MASKFKRKDGTWAIKFQIPETGNKWHYAYASKKTGLDDAQRAKTKKILEQLEKEAEKEKDRFNPCLDSFFETWSAQRALEKSVKGNTQYQENSLYQRHISPVLGRMRLQDISRQDIKNFRNGLITGGKLSPASINLIIRLLSKILDSATDNEDENGNLLLDYNPCKALTKKQLKEIPVRKERHRDLISTNDLAPFFAEAKRTDAQYYNLCLFGAYTGMRIGEVIALKVGAVDFDNAVVNVKQTLTRTEYGGMALGTTKTTESERSIPLCKQALEIAREQIKTGRELRGLNVNEKDEYLFFNSRLHMARPNDINNEIKRICSNANLQPFTFHAFRNAFTYKLQAVDAPASIIDELLGHTLKDTTGKHYTHINIENNRKWLNKAFEESEAKQEKETAI